MSVMRIVYFCMGWVMVALGVIGAVTPLLPTTIFLIRGVFRTIFASSGGVAARSSEVRQAAAGLACRRGDLTSGQADGLRGHDDRVCLILCQRPSVGVARRRRGSVSARQCRLRGIASDCRGFVMTGCRVGKNLFNWSLVLCSKAKLRGHERAASYFSPWLCHHGIASMP